MFMAYHFAKYVEKVASVGRSQYPIPLYTNAAMNDVNADDIRDFPFVAGGTVPGVYPSGGPVPTVLDIWQNFAPTIDFIGPDIYLGNYETACGHFQHLQQPLFIPEQRRDAYGARRAWTAFGSFQAIGVAPFGIDSQDPTDTAFATTYILLSKVSRQILAAQRQPSSIYGFHFDEVAADGKDAGTTISITMADWNLSIQRTFVFGRRGPGYGIIIHQGAGKFLLVGEGYQVAFKQPGKTFTGILAVRELDVADSASGNLEVFRKLNGDETQSGNAVILPSAKPDTGGFPIPCFLPANTRIVECEVYSVDEDDSLA